MARFRDNLDRSFEETDARIYVQVLPGDLPFPVEAMVDTAAPWCIFSPLIGERLRPHLDILREPVFLHTRLGRFRGALYRGSVKIPADEGIPLEVDAVMFLCEDWPGGNFVGYQGFLQNIRFAVDPHRNRFYFASL
ncbi:MAG TPA: hypothetical protein VF756_06580 [Thermoanaerobaculia bacterium]